MFHSTKFSLVTVGLMALACLNPRALARSHNDMLSAIRRGEATVVPNGSTTKEKTDSHLTNDNPMFFPANETPKTNAITGIIGNPKNYKVSNLDTSDYLDIIEDMINQVDDQDAKECLFNIFRNVDTRRTFKNLLNDKGIKSRFESMRSEAEFGAEEAQEFIIKSPVFKEFIETIPSGNKNVLALKELSKQLINLRNTKSVPLATSDENPIKNTSDESGKALEASSESRDTTQFDKVPFTDDKNTPDTVEKLDNRAPLRTRPAYQPESLSELGSKSQHAPTRRSKSKTKGQTGKEDI